MTQDVETSLPEAVTTQIGARIRNLRRHQNRTLQALANETDLSVGYLSQIERNLATPSLASLTKIANSLGVGIEHFVPLRSTGDLITRASERKSVWVDERTITYERLHADFPGANFSSFIMTLQPGFVGDLGAHDGEEFFFQLEGQTTIELNGTAHVLSPGDTMHFRSDMQHQARNEGDVPAKMMWLGDVAELRLRPGGM